MYHRTPLRNYLLISSFPGTLNNKTVLSILRLRGTRNDSRINEAKLLWGVFIVYLRGSTNAGVMIYNSLSYFGRSVLLKQ